MVLLRKIIGWNQLLGIYFTTAFWANKFLLGYNLATWPGNMTAWFEMLLPNKKRVKNGPVSVQTFLLKLT